MDVRMYPTIIVSSRCYDCHRHPFLFFVCGFFFSFFFFQLADKAASWAVDQQDCTMSLLSLMLLPCIKFFFLIISMIVVVVVHQNIVYYYFFSTRRQTTTPVCTRSLARTPAVSRFLLQWLLLPLFPPGVVFFERTGKGGGVAVD